MSVLEDDIANPDDEPGTEHDVRSKLAEQQQQGWTPDMGYAPNPKPQTINPRTWTPIVFPGMTSR